MLRVAAGASARIMRGAARRSASSSPVPETPASMNFVRRPRFRSNATRARCWPRRANSNSCSSVCRFSLRCAKANGKRNQRPSELEAPTRAYRRRVTTVSNAAMSKQLAEKPGFSPPSTRAAARRPAPSAPTASRTPPITATPRCSSSCTRCACASSALRRSRRQGHRGDPVRAHDGRSGRRQTRAVLSLGRPRRRAMLKVDQGMEKEADGVTMMKPIAGLDDLLKRAVKLGIYGTKMRSTINLATRRASPRSRNSSMKSARRFRPTAWCDSRT